MVVCSWLWDGTCRGGSAAIPCPPSPLWAALIAPHRFSSCQNLLPPLAAFDVHSVLSYSVSPVNTVTR